MIRSVFEIASCLRYFPRQPEVDLEYRKFIRRFPCIGCGTTHWVEFMHTGPRGLGQKADDKDGLPGCAACHRTGPQALHKIGPVKFQQLKKIDFSELRAIFQWMYQERMKP